MRRDTDTGLTPREAQIVREQARLDVCLPNGGHEYDRGDEACIHCGEPFPVIARDYGESLMPGLLPNGKVWVPNGTGALVTEYRNIIRRPAATTIPMAELRNADLAIVGDAIIKNRFGAEGKLRTLDSFFEEATLWDCDASGHLYVMGKNRCTQCGLEDPNPTAF